MSNYRKINSDVHAIQWSKRIAHPSVSFIYNHTLAQVQEFTKNRFLSSPIQIVAISLILFSLLITVANAAPLAPSGKHPRPRSDGQLCMALPGGVQGMTPIYVDRVGTTYYADTAPERTIRSAFPIVGVFAFAFSDADGAPFTQVTAYSIDGQIGQWQIHTENNEWSADILLDVPMGEIEIVLPESKPSTSLCILRAGVQATGGSTFPQPTPILTVTITPTYESPVTPMPPTTPAISATTSITEASEPIRMGYHIYAPVLRK